MADIAPFRGIRYAPAAGDLSTLTAPPYDVISPDERERLERLDPHNVVRLILGRDEPLDSPASNKYTRASVLLRSWLSSGVLVEDRDPSLYLYEQRYTVYGESRVQRGLLAAVSLDAASILPHERTMAAPVADRLALMRATSANLEPIICVYAGRDGPGRDAISAAASEPLPAAFTTGDGVEHRLRAITDVDAIEAVRASLSGVRLLIADGHHRFRTAQAYRDERRAAAGPGSWDAMMILVVDAAWSGPSVLPIHRLVSGMAAEEALPKLGQAFKIEVAERDPVALERDIVARRDAARCFVLLDRERAWWLTLTDERAAGEAMPLDRSEAWRDLDVAVLQALVFERLLATRPGYAHSAAEVDEALAKSDADLGFLLAPTPFEAVRRIAEAGEAMPPKSTYFFPKPRSGVVMRLLED